MHCGVVHSIEDEKSLWQLFASKPYRPECLTVYLSNLCNMGCLYCYAAEVGKKDRQKASGSIIDEIIVQRAAEIVADHCVRKKMPMRVVFHGGGEPTVHWSLLHRLESATRRVAAEYNTEWWGYLATNGTISKEKANWIADHFNLIGLSCDGPPDIQNSQRPFLNGAPSSEYVERTASIFNDKGVDFCVRSTITPRTMERQSEIVIYLIERLGAAKIRFEPLYNMKEETNVQFQSEDAEPFVDHFIKAQETAHVRGCHLSYSGVRINEVHGSYCNILRNVLHLNCDGRATACFFDTGGRETANHPATIGYYDRDRDVFKLDPDLIALHKAKICRIPERCQNCVIAYHCVHECPEICMAGIRNPKGDHEPGFRCMVNLRLAEHWMAERILL